MYLQYRLDACISPIIAEKDLYNIMKNIMNAIILEKSIIIDSMLKLYQNTLDNSKYDDEIKEVYEELKRIEEKKTYALDLVFNGDINKESLKMQFKQYEERIKELMFQKQELIFQKNLVSSSQNNIEKLSKSIEEEINGGLLEDFIRKFVDEIIISKIDNDRYNIKMDIYLNLLGKEKKKTKGAKHINGPLENDLLYLENQKIDSIEVLRKDRKTNKFTYNVYIETL